MANEIANEINLEVACKQVLGITSMRYRQLAADNVVPPITKGKIDFFLACKMLLDYYRKLAQGQGSMSLTDERTRLTRINADRKELDLQKAKGELIEAKKLDFVWGRAFMAAKQKLEAIPTKLPSLVAGQKSITKIKAKTEDFIREVQNELASIDIKQLIGKRNRNNRVAVSNAKTDAKTKRKPVGGRKKNTKPRSKRGAR